jgi:nucleoid DNA-binding protein
MALGKAELVKEIAEEVDLPTRAVKDVLDLLAEIAHEEISGGEDFTVPGIAKLKYKYTPPQKKGERYKKGETYTGFGGVEQVAEQDSPVRKEKILLVPALSTELNRIKPKRTPESQSAFLKSKTGKAVKKRLAA